MSLKRILLITLFLILLPFTLKLHGGDFRQASSLFSDIKAPRVGDILTVNTYEKTQATDKTETIAEKTCRSSARGNDAPVFSILFRFSAPMVKTCATETCRPSCR